MISTENIIDNICKKYGLISSTFTSSYITYWHLNISDSPLVSYDTYFGKLKLASYILFTDKDKPIFCLMTNKKWKTLKKVLIL